ncbi:hypothetical protein LCE31_38060, partial [Streptomyces sp. 8L]|nr:hypothetical protein [Streptomyces sp. 8L]
MAWLLACLVDASKKSVTGLATEIHFNKSTVSRVTDRHLSASVEVVKAYVLACGEHDSTPWQELYRLAKQAREDPTVAEVFAKKLQERCAASLGSERLDELQSAGPLTLCWAAASPAPGNDNPIVENPPQTPTPPPKPDAPGRPDRPQTAAPGTPSHGTDSSNGHTLPPPSHRTSRRTVLTGIATLCLAGITASIITGQPWHHTTPHS